MKASIEMDIAPFTIPNFVREKTDPGDASKEGYAVPLSALDPLTLDRLCRDFRDAVFNKAGKQKPPEPARYCPKCERRV